MCKMHLLKEKRKDRWIGQVDKKIDRQKIDKQTLKNKQRERERERERERDLQPVKAVTNPHQNSYCNHK